MTVTRLDTRLEIKAVDTSQRLIDGWAAAIGNRDRQGDVIDKGAFDRTLKENDDVLVFIGHDASRLPVGEPVRMREEAKGLFTQTRVYNTPAGDELLEVAKQRMASGRTLGMSIGFRTVKQRYEGGARHLLDVDLLEFSFLAAPQLAANPEAVMTGMKQRKATSVGQVITTDDSHEELRERLQTAAAAALGRSYCYVCVTFDDHVIVSAYSPDDEESHFWDIPYTLDAAGEPEMGEPAEVDPAFVPADAKARAKAHEEHKPVKVWTAELKAALPDVAFAYIESGGTLDDGGLTTPRAKRHFPHHDDNGDVDEGLLRDALTLARKSADSDGLAHLLRHAHALGLSEPGGHDDAHTKSWSSGAAPALLVVAQKIAAMAEEVAAEQTSMQHLGMDTKDNQRIRSEMRQRLTETKSALQAVIDWAETVDRGEDGAAYVDRMRYELELLQAGTGGL